MRKILVVGIGIFGRSLALSLSQKGMEVIAVDRNRDTIEEIADKVDYAIRADATDERALGNLGIDGIDLGIACIGENFEANLLATVNMKQLGLPQVICRAKNEIQMKIYRSIGIEVIINPERDAAEQLALQVAHGGVIGAVPLPGGNIFAKINAPTESWGRSLAELNLRAKYGLNLISVQRETRDGSDGEVLNPDANFILAERDELHLIGHERDIIKFTKR